VWAEGARCRLLGLASEESLGRPLPGLNSKEGGSLGRSSASRAMRSFLNPSLSCMAGRAHLTRPSASLSVSPPPWGRIKNWATEVHDRDLPRKQCTNTLVAFDEHKRGGWWGGGCKMRSESHNLRTDFEKKKKARALILGKREESGAPSLAALADGL